MAKAKVSHDITISTVGGTTLGFMLYRNGQKRPFRLNDAQTLRPRVLGMGELTEAEFPPEYRAYTSQEDWRVGLGGLTHREDVKRLANAVKIDASTRGRLFPASELKLSAVNTTPTKYAPTGFGTVGTEVVAFIGREPYTWDYGTPDWHKGTAPVASAFIYRNGVEFKGETYVCCWQASDDAPQAYIHKADADADGSWTRVTTSPNTPKYLAKGRNSSGDEILWGGNWGSGSTHVIRSTTDPTSAANWSAKVAIGQSDSEITCLVQDGDTVLVCKTNGIWAYYTDGTSENLTPEFETNAHPDNFRESFNWNGHIILPIGAGGMRELVGGKLFDISLELVAPLQTTLHGRVVAVTGDDDSLFIMVQDVANTDYHLMMAKWMNFQGVNDFRWHHVATAGWTTSTIEEHAVLFAEGIPSGSTIHHRVWMGVPSGGSNELPFFYSIDDTDAEFGFTNDTDAHWQSTEIDQNLPKVEKTWATIDIESADLGAGGRTIELQYRLDAGSWLTDLNDAAGNADGVVDTSPDQVMTFPAGSTGKILEVRGYPKLTSVGTTGAAMIYFRVTSQLRPDSLKLIPLDLHLGDRVPSLNGSRRNGRPKLDLAQLETWDEQAAEVTVVDPRGTSRTMVFLPGMLKITELSNEAGHRPEYRVQTMLAEV